MAKFSADILPLRIVSDQGEKGGIVEMPVCRASVVDQSRTAGGGPGHLDITEEILQEMVDNFSLKPGPVPVYFGHDVTAPRQPDTPAAGFVIGSWLDNGVLWNRIKFGPKAFDLVARQGGFAGASIEAEKDKATPIRDLPGWVQTGLSVTNTPALDIQYLAASERPDGSNVVFSKLLVLGDTSPNKKEKVMAFDEKEKVQLEGKVAELESKLSLAAKDKERIAALELEIVELKKRPTPEKIVALEAEINSIREDQVKDKVTALVTSAIAAGKPAAFFEGALKDPIAFLKTRFSGSVDSLRASADALPVVAKIGPTSTQSGGTNLGDGSSPKEKLFAEIRKVSAEKKLSFSAATDHVKATNPELYASGMTAYFNTPLPGSKPGGDSDEQ